MYTIKKYANGRFYDTETKNYITRDQIADLLNTQKKITIVETKTGKNITSDVTSKISAKASKAGTAKKSSGKKSTAKKAAAKKTSRKTAQDAAGFFTGLFRKSGDTLSDYGKKYAAMWQDLLTLSREEIDKVINMLVKDKKITEFEGKKLKDEIIKHRDNIQSWITKNIDTRINEILDRMNLANRDQVLDLTTKIDSLNKKIAQMEGSKKSAGAKKSS